MFKGLQGLSQGILSQLALISDILICHAQIDYYVFLHLDLKEIIYRIFFSKMFRGLGFPWTSVHMSVDV